MKTYQNIQLLPTEEQQLMLWKHINGCRFIWNHMLGIQKERLASAETPLSLDDMGELLSSLKSKEDTAWLNELIPDSLKLVCRELIVMNVCC
jgi:putative transposase